MNSQNYTNFLNNKEQKTLKLINDKSNFIRKEHERQNNIFNKTLYEIATEWSLNHQKMLDEIVTLVKKVNKMDDFAEYNNWWRYLTKNLNDFMIIITKDDRMIYSGITIIIIAFLLFVINSSS